MKYIMITYWDNHWDKITSTYYTKNMFREGMKEEFLKNNTETIFIKINNESKEPEKAWKGRVTNISLQENKVNFSVEIEKEILIPEKYKGKPEGWYVELESFLTYDQELLTPPFFYVLGKIKDWNFFEYYVYFLLKLIGINNIYKFEKQKGHPDGFFKLRNLVVLYDSTLEEDFMKSKKIQIENFCAQLLKDEIEIEKTKISIRNCYKEVWIITKNTTKVLEKINEIRIKEVSIFSLFEIFYYRLTNITNEEKLEECLKNLGESTNF